jgi:hypothetical protein
MKNYIIGILIFFAIIGYVRTHKSTPRTIIYEEAVSQPVQTKSSVKKAPSTEIQQTSLYSGRQAQGSGVIVRTLSDDTKGSRHQRFIIRVPSGRTLLIAHNIDLAPRISFLNVGDTVVFNGVYESNAKGGVIHWTHHDPSGKHQSGWLKHNGRTYQ